MTFERLRHTWETLGRDDPLWAVLSDPSKYNNRWDSAEFFETGRTEVDTLFQGLHRRGIEPSTHRCLDFGCGVGRVTQALCTYFERVDGVDIAGSMIDAARQHNQYGDSCRYHLNVKDDLKLFEDATFDLVYSNIVLQHMETDLAERYIAEFMRVLAPSGLAVFQVPSQLHEVARTPLKSYQADIRVEGVPRFHVGVRRAVNIVVRNLGSDVWPASGPLQAGNHWLDKHGSMLVQDDGRAPLSEEVRPGDERTVGVWVTAPPSPGRYILEFDMVDEDVAWFADRGSATARSNVVVARPPLRMQLSRTLRKQKHRNDRDRAGSSRAIMEMHAVPKERVISLATTGGGEILDIEDFDVSGPGWESYRYFIRKL